MRYVMNAMPDKKNQNEEYLQNAIDTLNQVAANPSTPKNIRKNIQDLANDLKIQEHSMSVRASNVISLLDDIIQDPNVPSYVRLTFWQAVSTLENIRE